MAQPTQGERIAVLEAIHAAGQQQVMERLEEIAADIKTIKKEVGHEREARLALENKGKGALAVASLVFTAIGAFVTAFWDQIKALFH